MSDAELVAVLEDAQGRGFLGPGPVRRQLQHAQDLAAVLDGVLGPFTGTYLDLGSGGGLPGLALGGIWPEAHGALLDAQRRRCTFLQQAVDRLGLTPRIGVVCGRAESLARHPELRANFDLVVARAFGAPPVTAECAAGFLRAGGRLVVSEPPEGEEGEVASARWSEEGLAQLGFAPPMGFSHGGASAAVLELTAATSDKWPRRDGVPSKRPLW
jgi:16S rRNA (guanine527-N7)-methyltransferase